MNHPCNNYSCCENYHGECYGEGCKLNPMPTSEPEAEDGENDSDNQPTTKTKGETHK